MLSCNQAGPAVESTCSMCAAVKRQQLIAALQHKNTFEQSGLNRTQLQDGKATNDDVTAPAASIMWFARQRQASALTF